MGEGSGDQRIKEALSHLVGFEAALVSAYAARGGMSKEQIGGVMREATAATALKAEPSPFRALPEALSMVAERLVVLGGLREVDAEDIVRAMMAVESSWSPNPDKRLWALEAEEREPFTLRMMDIDEEISKAKA